MVDLWLDSNIFIDSKSRFYTFDIAPGFWRILEDKAAKNILKIPSTVYQEITGHFDHQDELCRWLIQRESIFSVPPDAPAQAAYSQVVGHVSTAYDYRHATEFYGKADGWLVAYAVSHGGSVVTFEARDNSVNWAKKKVKIPNVCDAFHISCLERDGMMRQLGAVLN